MTDKAMQEKFIQLQILHQQMQHLQQQMQQLEQQEIELMLVKDNIKELSSVQKGTEILVPVAAGIFARATWEANPKFLINVGMGATVEKTPDEVVALVDSQQKEAEKLKNEMETHMDTLVKQAQTLG